MKAFWIALLFGVVLAVNSQRFRPAGRPPPPPRPAFFQPPTPRPVFFQPPPPPPAPRPTFFQPPPFRPRPQVYETLNLPDGAEFIVGNVQASFSCEGRRYGYYADVGNGCRLFHVCLPVADESGFSNTLQWSFFCGNQTIFNQELLVCDHAETVDCSQAERFYYKNDEFGIIPPRKF